MAIEIEDRFKGWDEDKLRSYLAFLLHHYRVMDAFWFLNVEKSHGHEEACRINELVWGKATELAVKDLKSRFFDREKGLGGFVKALKVWPWTILVDYRIEEREEEVLVSVDHCPPQEARLARGLGEYDCKAMHLAEFESFALGIDPRIRTECLFAPLDDHPEDCFCCWRFTLRTGFKTSP